MSRSPVSFLFLFVRCFASAFDVQHLFCEVGAWIPHRKSDAKATCQTANTDAAMVQGKTASYFEGEAKTEEAQEAVEIA